MGCVRVGAIGYSNGRSCTCRSRECRPLHREGGPVGIVVVEDEGVVAGGRGVVDGDRVGELERLRIARIGKRVKVDVAPRHEAAREVGWGRRAVAVALARQGRGHVLGKIEVRRIGDGGVVLGGIGQVAAQQERGEQDGQAARLIAIELGSILRRIGADQLRVHAKAVDHHVALRRQENRLRLRIQVAHPAARTGRNHAGHLADDGVCLIGRQWLARQIIGKRTARRDLGDVGVVGVGNNLHDGNQMRIRHESGSARGVGNCAALIGVGINDDGANLALQRDVTSDPRRGVAETRLVLIWTREVEAPRDPLSCPRV